MELGKFRQDPIAPILRAHFVEARLHTDGAANLARIQELQREYVGDIGLPNYIIVDPQGLHKLGRFEGICVDQADVERFVKFLNQGYAAITRS